MEEIKFLYKPKLSQTIFLIIFAIIFIYIGISIASTNKKGIVFFHLIELSPESATIFLWSLPFFFGIFLWAGLASLYRRFQKDLEIIISKNHISSPKSLVSGKIIKINFADVTEFYIETVNKNKSLVIIHSKGKLSISSMVLQSEKIFNELTFILSERVGDGKTFSK
jgi:hypothetical protein